jgi:phage/plasmid-associated DNA primase
MCTTSNKSKHSSTNLLKTLVSGDPITAEHKFKSAFVFRNYAKLIVSTNLIPETEDKTFAFFRRGFPIQQDPKTITDLNWFRPGPF